MSYEQAMEAAGAKVLAFEQFGSYQGDWWALVEFQDKRGFVHGYYGSCSGCDAFEGEFGYSNDPWCDQHSYRPDADCKGCQEAKAKRDEKLAAFGKDYLDVIVPRETAVVEASKNLEWDGDAQAVVDWLQSAAASPSQTTGND